MSSNSWRLTSRRALLIIGLIVIVVVVAVFVIIYTSHKAEAVEYRREPVGTTSVPAFTRPVGTDQRNVASPSSGGRTFQSNTPGLYAGTPGQAPCDGQALITELQADPRKAAAWSQIQGIRSADLPNYVNQLSSVTLRSDTYVTSYGFRGGEVTWDGLVLQAGTAVFIDKRGTPVAKCNCGNPVKVTAPPQGAQATFSGPSWSSFSSNSVTVVNRSSTVVNQITMVQINKDIVFVRGVGDGSDENSDDNILSRTEYPRNIAMGGVQGVIDLPPPPKVTPNPSDTETESPPTTEPPSDSTSPPGTTESPSPTTPPESTTPPDETTPPPSEPPPSEQPPSEQPSEQPPSQQPPSEQPSEQPPTQQPQQPQQPPGQPEQPQQPQPEQPQPQQPQPQQPQEQPPAS
ncbi:DUF6777 domain-containing protein [Streptomyces sp. NEAU-174]|uniref:DUF6777 domain-containing protein n=1 Tax=Streptomyces sp. NEAU-174 TaxID=3458254 RepID=UPI00404485E3